MTREARIIRRMITSPMPTSKPRNHACRVYALSTYSPAGPNFSANMSKTCLISSTVTTHSPFFEFSFRLLLLMSSSLIGRYLPDSLHSYSLRLVLLPVRRSSQPCIHHDPMSTRVQLYTNLALYLLISFLTVRQNSSGAARSTCAGQSGISSL